MKKKTDQELIAESIPVLIEEEGDGYSRVHLQTALARGQQKLYHGGKLVGHVMPRYALSDPDAPEQRWVAHGLVHGAKGESSQKELPGKLKGDHATVDDAIEAIKKHHKSQKIGEYVN